MAEMVPLIRKHQGYVAKLMGDGIYFFFGAPQPNRDHAADGVAALLTMKMAFDQFNIRLQERGNAPLGMRAGLSTGQVIIGDAGSPDCSDYTALGPTTNLASRLESANKVFGTYALITERTVELLKGAYLVRPIANLVVAGKTVPVPVYEPICPIEKATDEQRLLVLQTQGIIDAYRAGDFNACIAAADKMIQTFGPSKLGDFYSSLSRENIANPPTDFDGRVILTEK
jgi:adenylate cyclase